VSVHLHDTFCVIKITNQSANYCIWLQIAQQPSRPVVSVGVYCVVVYATNYNYINGNNGQLETKCKDDGVVAALKIGTH